MSYILDALKKSERERSGARAGEGAGDAANTPARMPWPLILILVLASNALLGLGWWLWSRTETTAPATDAATVDAPAGTHAPATPATPIPMTPPTSAIAKAPVGDLAAEAKRTPSARDDASAGFRASAPAAPSPRARPAMPSLEDRGAQPVVARPAVASVPWLRELPASFRSAVAPLSVNIHVYAGSSEDSVLYINDRQYRAGESLPNGVRVDAVVADGAVLSYQGQQFKLPRPN